MDGMTTGAGGGGIPRAGGLGLGLGLNPMQRGRFLQAAQSGPGGGLDYLSTHPELRQRIENRVPGGSDQDRALQDFMATGQAPTGAAVRYGNRPNVQGAGDMSAGAGGGGPVTGTTPDVQRGMPQRPMVHGPFNRAGMYRNPGRGMGR